MVVLEFELVETSGRAGEQFFEGIVKVISNACHICAINFRSFINIVIGLRHVERFVSITEPSSNWLVNKNYVVLLRPTVVVFLDIIWLHVCSSKSECTQLKEITELTG